MCCVETQNKCRLKYLAVFSIRKPNFVNVTQRQLFEKKIYILFNFATDPFMALGAMNGPRCFHQWTICIT